MKKHLLTVAALAFAFVANAQQAKSLTEKDIEVTYKMTQADFLNEINKSDYEKYDFEMAKLNNNGLKLKYSSIFNIFTLLINGFKKIFNYPFLKKLLLVGFLLSGMFIFYSLSNIAYFQYHLLPFQILTNPYH